MWMKTKLGQFSYLCRRRPECGTRSWRRRAITAWACPTWASPSPPSLTTAKSTSPSSGCPADSAIWDSTYCWSSSHAFNTSISNAGWARRSSSQCRRETFALRVPCGSRNDPQVQRHEEMDWKKREIEIRKPFLLFIILLWFSGMVRFGYWINPLPFTLKFQLSSVFSVFALAG